MIRWTRAAISARSCGRGSRRRGNVGPAPCCASIRPAPPASARDRRGKLGQRLRGRSATFSDLGRETAYAASRLSGRASPLPAISKPTPWSGEVRTTGRPRVTFTPPQKSSILTGIKALIVIEADDRVDGVLARLGMEQAVGGQVALYRVDAALLSASRTAGAMMSIPPRGPRVAAFAGMRIEARRRRSLARFPTPKSLMQGVILSLRPTLTIASRVRQRSRPRARGPRGSSPG